MSEESDRMMTLLQELAVLKEEAGKKGTGSPTARRKRRQEISQEMKELAAEKKRAED